MCRVFQRPLRSLDTSNASFIFQTAHSTPPERGVNWVPVL